MKIKLCFLAICPKNSKSKTSIAGFVGFYTLLLIVEMYLMVKFARQGPGSLGTGRYANESAHA